MITKEFLQNYFHADFVSIGSLINDVLVPIFGDADPGYTEITATETLREKARNANILRIKHAATLSADGFEIKVFDVILDDNCHIHRSRRHIQTMIRQYIGHFEGALIAFHYANPADRSWRLSYLEKRANNTDSTSAKRYTYLCGKDYPCRTIAERFILLASQEKNAKNIDAAFSVEALSDEFFAEYKKQYTAFCDYIVANRNDATKFGPEFATCEDKFIRDYVKKMMGRLTFLHFLQKKGWLGQPRSQEGWGAGNVNFMRDLFAKATEEQKDNFLDEVLEPLFFDCLNDKREGDFFDTGVPGIRIVKIPYLNGGLFEKDEIDKPRSQFPKEMFQNLLDFYGQFNFTIDESDPLDTEVGVDPEMLGKIFENLLEDNKDKGAFYTPKEIVQYMCKESLITYLVSESQKKNEAGKQSQANFEEAIRAFVNDPEMTAIRMERYSEKQRLDLLESLQSVKICDPAIGSGAFPMGLLNLLVACQEALINTIPQYHKGPRAVLKQTIIQNNIYGVDIEKGAIDIARLRFWLSIVVDLESPKALPNFDYKFMQGNSLLEQFEGVDLTTAKDTVQKITLVEQPKKNLFDEYADIQTSVTYTQRGTAIEILEKMRAYFSTQEHEKKLQLRIEINDSVKKHIVYNMEMHRDECTQLLIQTEEAKRQTQYDLEHFTRLQDTKKTDSLSKKIEKYKKDIEDIEEQIKRYNEKITEVETDEFNPSANDQFFLWHTWFADVIEQGGFDIVIGNPPYIRQEKLGQEYKTLLTSIYPNVGNGTADIYVYFFGLGIKLLKQEGILAYITLNKFLKTKYGKELRDTLTNNVTVNKIIDFFELPIFNAATDAAITILTNLCSSLETQYFPVKTLENLDLERLTRGSYLHTIKNESEWQFVDDCETQILQKIQANTTSLKSFCNNKIYSGIKTGLNKAFVIKDSEIAKQLLNSESADIIKPYAVSTDIHRWTINDDDKFFIATGYDLDIDKYPTVKEYMNQFIEELSTRGDHGLTCYNLRPCAYYDEIEKPKIIYIHTAKKHQFYLDTEGHYINNSCYMIVSNSRFLWCFLNSKLFDYYKKIKFVAYGDGQEAGRCKLDYNKMVTIPIKLNVDERPFTELTDEVLKNPQTDTSSIENQIDELIYDLYGLTEEEKEIIRKA